MENHLVGVVQPHEVCVQVLKALDVQEWKVAIQSVTWYMMAAISRSVRNEENLFL
jgi:hypothetical protein